MMNPYERFAHSFGKTRSFAWLGRTVIRPLDSFAMRKWVPDSTLGLNLSLVYLTSIGRRSGQPRTVPLLAVPSDDGGTVVVGTNWGGPRHPDWVYNLQADPNAVLDQNGAVIDVAARPATEPEFDLYWARLTEIWPPYDAYRERAGRDINMFVLTEM